MEEKGSFDKVNLKSIIDVLTGAGFNSGDSTTLKKLVNSDKYEFERGDELNKYDFLASANENILVMVLNADGTYKYVSPSITTILGFNQEYLIGKGPEQLIHPGDLERLSSVFFSTLNVFEPIYIKPFRVINAKGEWSWQESIGINKLNDPQINGLVVHTWDVTHKMNIDEVKSQAEKKIKINEERFNTISNATFDVIWDWNIENNEVFYSDNFYYLFGYKPGLKPFDYDFYIEHVHPDDKEKFIFSPEHIIHGPMTNWLEEYRFKKADGQYAYVQDKAIIMRDENGKATRMVGAMRDITELKKKEIKIIEQNRQLKEIAQINAHSIRGPLATILGLLQLFDERDMGEENRKVLEYMRIATNDLDEVIHSVILKAHMNKTGKELVAHYKSS